MAVHTANHGELRLSNNLVLGASSPNTAYRNRTVQFVAPAQSDFHLHPDDTAAQGAGQSLAGDPGFPFSTDLDGQQRTDPWDIGADQVP